MKKNLNHLQKSIVKSPSMVIMIQAATGHDLALNRRGLHYYSLRNNKLNAVYHNCFSTSAIVKAATTSTSSTSSDTEQNINPQTLAQNSAANSQGNAEQNNNSQTLAQNNITNNQNVKYLRETDGPHKRPKRDSDEDDEGKGSGLGGLSFESNINSKNDNSSSNSVKCIDHLKCSLFYIGDIISCIIDNFHNFL